MNEIKIPTNCPTCNSILERIKDQLFCKNSSCAAKSSKKLEHYAKTMKIMGLGTKTLEKLEVNNLTDLYSLEEYFIISKLGEKIGTKIVVELEKSKDTTISKFISAMSIPLIGKVAAEKLESVVSSIAEINETTCKKAGLGPKATNNLLTWVNNEYDETLPIKFNEVDNASCFYRTVCISGKIPGYTKSQLKELLADFNVNVVENVSKKIDYLITEEGSGTSKVKQAESFNINIITLNKFMEIIENE